MPRDDWTHKEWKTEKLLTWTTNASRPNVHLFHHNCNIPFPILIETCASCLLTCKCPWYILSTQSVSVTGSSFYASSRLVWDAQCQTPSVDIRSRRRVFGLEVQKGADRAELSSARVLKLTLCAHPGYLSALTHGERRRTALSFLSWFFNTLQIPEIVLTWKTQTNKNKILSRFKSSSWARFPFGLALNVLTLLLRSLSSYSALLSPVSQLLPLTQPSGASPSDDVLGEETHVHSSLSLALKIVFRKFQKFRGVEEEFIAEGFWANWF